MYKILVTILSAAALIDAGQTCPPNEEWKECSSACEFTCDDYLDRSCTDDCRPPKCQCIYGYVRNSDGECIPQENCPRKACRLNEEWKECSSECEFTCDDYLDGICTDACGPRKCQCIYGYVRNSNGECIPQENCPRKTCPLNEEWMECSSCEGTCDNPNPICPSRCQPPKCQCKDGYVRNHSTGKCVLANSNQC